MKVLKKRMDKYDPLDMLLVVCGVTWVLIYIIWRTLLSFVAGAIPIVIYCIYILKIRKEMKEDGKKEN